MLVIRRADRAKRGAPLPILTMLLVVDSCTTEAGNVLVIDSSRLEHLLNPLL